jgi:hypothetical protein
MTSGAQTREGQFIKVGWGLPCYSSGPLGILGVEVDDTRDES